ncbi:hypothetical protein [Parvibaculum sp.]|uniref:hypothetical protein n=1 Tax=Parvibaculum sp. TaxID=2024848 RepID=UPI000C62C283|nr:hypothetical protein [Parvibaculum sp.]MAM93252.1 hypothetical protein [Parvibaculum sp.]|tara:strand:+ start:3354 stop:3842 length:489 start_codon:yes stop_codon:yes gene_type:complete
MRHQQWIVCGPEFIEGDVIRWHEGVFQPDGYRRGQRVKVGDRAITAQVLFDPVDGNRKLELEVVASEGKNAYEVGDTVRRARRTVGHDDTERLAWSDEEARASVVDSLPEAKLRAMQKAQTHVAPPATHYKSRTRTAPPVRTGSPWQRRRRRQTAGAYDAKP